MDNNLKNKTTIERFAQGVINKRWLVLFGSIILAMMAGMGGQNLKFNNDYHVFFDDDNPQVLAFDAIQEKYTKDDNVFIVIAPEDGEVFSKKTIEAIAELEQKAWLTPFSNRVDALTNYQHTHSVGDDMFVENLTGDDLSSLTEGDLKRIENISLNEPLLVNRIVNDKGTVTAININVTLPADSMEAPMVVAQHVRKMVEEWKAENPGFKTYLSGIIMMNATFAELSMGDMGTLVPGMFLVILLVLLLTIRSISGMVASLIVLILSIMTAMGTAGWMGIELTGPSSSAPTMIMTLAIADSIHILVTMIQLMRAGMTKNEAISESVRVNFMPVLITSVTTVIGFLTLNFAEGAPFHDLGNITAVGVTAAFLFSIFLLPALMSILPLKVKQQNAEDQKLKILDVLSNFVIANRNIVLIGSVIFMAGFSSLALKNELNNEFIKFFAEDVPFRQDTDFISDNLTGIYNIEFSLSSGEEDGISEPDYLKKVDEFEQWFRSKSSVSHVSAFSETMKRVNKSMHGDSIQYYRVPDGRQEAAQYLLLYEMSLPYGLDLNNQINVDKSETRFTVTTENISSKEMIDLAKESEDWLAANAPEEMFTHGVSPTLMFSHIAKTNLESMLFGGFGALVVISLILMFALRSVKYGLISIIPNVAPISVAFGIWYLYSGMIDMGLSVALGMTLGIVVDDTIHLLSKYIRARKEMGKSAADAIRYSFDTVGRAVIVTTVILTAGFSVLMQSSFGFNSGMSTLTAITIVVALVLDLLLLPAILLLVDKDKK